MDYVERVNRAIRAGAVPDVARTTAVVDGRGIGLRLEWIFSLNVPARHSAGGQRLRPCGRKRP